MRDEEWYDETSGELLLTIERTCDECGVLEDEDGRCPSCGKPL